MIKIPRSRIIWYIVEFRLVVSLFRRLSESTCDSLKYIV